MLLLLMAMQVIGPCECFVALRTIEFASSNAMIGLVSVQTLLIRKSCSAVLNCTSAWLAMLPHVSTEGLMSEIRAGMEAVRCMNLLELMLLLIAFGTLWVPGTNETKLMRLLWRIRLKGRSGGSIEGLDRLLSVHFGIHIVPNF